MTPFVVLDSCLVGLESVLNIVGYLPNQQEYIRNPDSHTVSPNPYLFKPWVTNFRYRYGQILLITSLAVSLLSAGISLIYEKDAYQKLAKQALTYAGHGVLNIMRSSLESRGWGALTLAYDLYNQKVLTYAQAAPSCDLQGRLFTCLKFYLDKAIAYVFFS